MWIYDPNRECGKCTIKDTIFFAQKQRGNQISINNICWDCKTEERSNYYYRKDKHKRYLKGIT